MEKNVMDVEGKDLDLVEAEFVKIRQSTIRAVEGGHIELQQVGECVHDLGADELARATRLVLDGREDLVVVQSALEVQQQ